MKINTYSDSTSDHMLASVLCISTLWKSLGRIKAALIFIYFYNLYIYYLCNIAILSIRHKGHGYTPCFDSKCWSSTAIIQTSLTWKSVNSGSRCSSEMCVRPLFYFRSYTLYKFSYIRAVESQNKFFQTQNVSGKKIYEWESQWVYLRLRLMSRIIIWITLHTHNLSVWHLYLFQSRNDCIYA